MSYVVTNPNFFPNVPPASALTPAQNSIYRVDPNLRAQYMMQSAIGVERQLPRNTTVAVTFTGHTRAPRVADGADQHAAPWHLHPRASPNSGIRPYGNAGNLFLYESGGMLRQNIIMTNFNTRFTRNLSLQGNYSYNTAKDLPASPSDPYNFALDWARSSLQRKHRFMLVGSMAAPWGLRLSPFITLQSGAPYDVTLGTRSVRQHVEERAAVVCAGARATMSCASRASAASTPTRRWGTRSCRVIT